MKTRQAVSELTVGVDLGDRKSVLCRLDAQAAVVERRTISTTAEAFHRYFSALPSARVVLEAGTHSPWVSRLLEQLGHEALVANPAALHHAGLAKSDQIDAEKLARWGRADPKMLHPIQHRGVQAQADLALLKARDALVRSRTLLINHVRGSVKSFGARLPSCSAESFARQVEARLPALLYGALAPLLELIASLTQQIRAFDREIEEACEEAYPETAPLRQVAGVGALTALCYVLVLEDPSRFPQRRAVGKYLGLIPRLEESSTWSPELPISKAGNQFCRRLLVQAAHYILGPFGPDTDLRRWGLGLANRGGKSAKKRAVVAVARKLAVLLHRLWTTGERYEPLRHARVLAPA